MYNASVKAAKVSWSPLVGRGMGISDRSPLFVVNCSLARLPFRYVEVVARLNRVTDLASKDTK